MSTGPDPHTSRGERLALSAPAKINLFLHVTGRRADGFHLLDSLVAFTEYGDGLSVVPDDRLILEIDGPFAPELGDDHGQNLVLRAGDLLNQVSGSHRGGRINLTKNLPIAAGIGGGSADAAAALRLMSRLWEIDAPAQTLYDIASRLGADVPVCLVSEPSVFAGIGERITPVPALPPCGVVLVNAREQVPTPAVFAARTGGFTPEIGWPVAANMTFDEMIRLLAMRRNDLGLAARSVSPVIGDVLGAIDATQGCRLARLSGSGGTCFGLYESGETAHRAAAKISDMNPHWWVAPTAFLTSAPEIVVR